MSVFRPKTVNFLNFKILSDVNFYKARFVGGGNIGPYIKFGGLSFSNNKVVTLCVKAGGGVM